MLSLPAVPEESSARIPNVVRLNMRKPSTPEIPETDTIFLSRISGFRVWPLTPFEPPKLYGFTEDGRGDPAAIRAIGWIETPNINLS